MKIVSGDSYEFMQLTYTMAVCCGLPITRRKIQKTDERDCNDHSVVRGHRYSFDARLVPVWLAYTALNAVAVSVNYRKAQGYMDVSFKKCFEESFCIAIVDLVNRNLGPLSVHACLMFCGRRHKVTALAGVERTLTFLRDTDAAVAGWETAGAAAVRRLLPGAKYYSAAVMAVYLMCIVTSSIVASVGITLFYAVYLAGQMAVYNLVMLQYYVLGRGYARVNQMLETMDVRPDPVAARRLLTRLSDVHDELSRLVDSLNRAYVLSLLYKWPYNIVWLIMTVLRIMELLAILRVDNHPYSRVAPILAADYMAEIGLFFFQLSCFCAIGEHLSNQAQKTLASLQKLKLSQGFQLDSDIKKSISIFWIRVNARKIKVNIGGYIIINMDFIKAVCGITATYFLVLIQFKFQNGKDKLISPFY